MASNNAADAPAHQGDSLHGKLVGRLGAPVEGFRGRAAARLGEDLQVVATGELTLRSMLVAIGRRQRALLSVLFHRPVGVAGLAIYIGQGRVDAVQARSARIRLITG